MSKQQSAAASGGERLRHPIPQRNNNQRGVVNGSSSPFLTSSPQRLVSILVPTTTTTDAAVSPLPSSGSSNRYDEFAAATTVSLVAMPPPPPVRPHTPNTNAVCSPLTISSDTWSWHSPSSLSPTKTTQQQQQLPSFVGGGGFVPIGSGADFISAPSPLSWALQQQQKQKHSSPSKSNNKHTKNDDEDGKESAYRPYASPLPPRSGSRLEHRLLQSSPYTADTCSVTTLGTATSTTATTVAAAMGFPPSPPLYRRPASALGPRSRSSSSSHSQPLVAEAAAWVPASKNSSSSKTTINHSNNSSSLYSNNSKCRPQSAPTLPTTTAATSTYGGNGFVEQQNAAAADAATQHQRKIRLKTELCMHHESGRICPFGDHCTYAHGEEELQMTKLQDLHDAGLIDKETYRTKPCLTWIMTGSCPFGRRCACIHDHRVAAPSSISSWLPHTETQGNTIATDINVDGLFQKRLYSILYDNPFGEQLDLEAATRSPDAAFNDLYALLCGEELLLAGGGRRGKSDGSGGGGWNHRSSRKGGRGRTGGRNSKGKHNNKAVHPIYKLQIALKLRGDADWQYKYRPQHVVHDELCMVLNKRAFRVTSNDPQQQSNGNGNGNKTARLTVSTATAISSVQEISLNAYNPRHDCHILVHEIAFGPDSDPSARSVSLWFGIDDEDVTICTPQQAKRFRWKKSMPMAATKSTSSSSSSSSPSASSPTEGNKIKPSVFDSGALESFPMIRPHDEAAFRLSTDMLRHRLAVLKRERMTNMKDRHENLRKLQHQKGVLVDRFRNQVRDWTAWAWPINAGRERAVDYNTPVPPVEGPYSIKAPPSSQKEDSAPVVGGKAGSTDVAVPKGVHVHRIWNSFVEQSPLLSDETKSPLSILPPAVCPRRRLEIFRDLSHGKEIDQCRALPHILHHHRATTTGTASGANKAATTKKDKPNPSHHQERCWKALLLQPNKTGGSGNSHEQQQTNEWSIVLQHFSNSRSHKVLTILQQ